MTLLEIIAALLALSALFGLVNYRILKLPHTIGLVVVALMASLIIVGLEALRPNLGISESVLTLLKSIDFRKVLLEGFLAALLFAGAVHVNLSDLAENKWAIALMATIGILISTFVVGGLIWLVASWVGFHLPFIWALVFGALISPTDPVAVLSILKHIKVPRLLQAKIAGESLLNDGVGVVVFTILVAIAVGAGAPDGGAIDTLSVIKLFLIEALGGAVLGLVAGLITYALLRVVDEHIIEVMITLALVTGVYALALRLHLSGPIAVVVAGLLIGNQGARFAMSESTRQHVFQFWTLIDEILNSVLFLLIGLEVLLIGRNFEQTWLALAAIPIVLGARLLAVSIPIGLLSIRKQFTDGTIRVLTWGGLRGGISVALALSLPDTPYKDAILTMTYVVVVFSILVQGLTMERLVGTLDSKPQS
ncbi:MAG: sodium:proton antiporter [Alphaproteobacteria bacterium]|nr:sodium:proton antiporter [Alphaproteobacteria bacterium]